MKIYLVHIRLQAFRQKWLKSIAIFRLKLNIPHITCTRKSSPLIFLLCCLVHACHRVTSRTTVSSNQKPVFIFLVCHLKCRVLCVPGVVFKVLQINSQCDVVSGCQTVKIVVSKPELAVQISKTLLVGRPITLKINRAVQTSLKHGPTSTVCGHVTQHLHWFAAIWVGGAHATGCETIPKKMKAALGLCW